MERSTPFSRLLIAVFVCALVQSRPAAAQDTSSGTPRVEAGLSLEAVFRDKNYGFTPYGFILYGNGNIGIYKQKGAEFCAGVQFTLSLGKNNKGQLYVQPTVAGGPVQTSVQFPVNGVDLEKLSANGADARIFVLAGFRSSNPKGFGCSVAWSPSRLRTLPNNRIMEALGSNTKGFAGVSSIEPLPQFVFMLEKGFPLGKRVTFRAYLGAGLLPQTLKNAQVGAVSGFAPRFGGVSSGARVELRDWKSHRDKR